METQTEITQASYDIIGCAIEVHELLGPGLLESVYEECLIQELLLQGMQVERQVEIPLYYKGKKLSSSYRVDLLVNEKIILELKVVEKVLSVHKAQLLSYLKLANKPKGILINFHTDNIVNSAVHLVTEQFRKLPK